MSALLRRPGVRKAFGGVQALRRLRGRGRAGSITGLIGPNGRARRLVQRHHRVRAADAGQVYLRRTTRSPGSAPDRVFALGIGRTFQLTRIFPRLTVLENMLVARRAGAPRPAARDGAAGVRRHRRAPRRAGRHLLLRPAQAAGAGLRAGRGPGRHPARRACRRDQSVPGQPDRRPDQGAERGRQDLPDRRAQHGVRDGPVRPDRGARLGRGGGRRAARHHPDRPPGARRLPGRGPGRDPRRRNDRAAAAPRPFGTEDHGPGGRVRRRRRAARGLPGCPRAASPAWWDRTGRQIHAPGLDQRAAAAAPRLDRARRAGPRRPAPRQILRPGRRAGAAEPQPVPRHDGPGEHRARRLHPGRPGADGTAGGGGVRLFPDIASWAGKKAGSLSGGQQRLVEFARA